jgi:lysophospholipase L1-like esterase
MLRRIRRAAAWSVAGTAAVIGAEIALAGWRRYLPAEPRLDLDGEFGPGRRKALSLVVLGDSTSAGVGAGDPEAAYPAVVARRLAQHLSRRVRLRNLGISGARMADLPAVQVPAAEQLQVDLAFVGIGGNDVTHLTPLRAVRRDLAETIDRLLATGAIVVVAGPADMRCRAFMEPLRSICGVQGRRVARAVEEVARGRGVPVVPLGADTARAIARDAQEYFSADGFHPGPGGYAVWADAITPVLLQALSERSARSDH